MILDRFPIMLRPPTVKKIKIIHTEEEFLYFVNKWNGVKNIYVNLYYFTKSKCCSSFYYFDKTNKKYTCNKCKKVIEGFDLTSYIVDCIVFDLDPSPNNVINREKELIKAKKMVNHFSKYKRYLIKSGKGFHFYISTEIAIDSSFKYGARNAIKNFQIEVEKKFGKTDWITHGDTSQMIRVPGTYNVNSRSFCMCMKNEMLNLNYNELNKISENQQEMRIFPIDSEIEKMNLKNYDKTIDYSEYIHEGELALEISEDLGKIDKIRRVLTPYNIIYDCLSECVKVMLNNEFLDYRQRYLLINILKNLGLSEKDCEKLLKITLFSDVDTENEDDRKRYDWAKHSIDDERQIYYVYREYYGIPSCKSGKMLGFENLGLCKKCKTKNIMEFRKNDRRK